MKKYFAKLDGDIVGVDTSIRFEAENDEQAKQFADEQAEEHFSSFDDTCDEDGCERFYSVVQPYDKDKHDHIFLHINTSGEFEILL